MKFLKLALFLTFTITPLQAQMTRSEKSIAFFKDLNLQTLDLIDEFYDPHVKFEDPLGKDRRS